MISSSPLMTSTKENLWSSYERFEGKKRENISPNRILIFRESLLFLFLFPLILSHSLSLCCCCGGGHQTEMEEKERERVEREERGAVFQEYDTNSNLFIHKDTFECACSLCVPCFYKIFPLWKSRKWPNQRPEMCPRARNQIFPGGLYSSGCHILTVGDGDFSFSCSLAEGLHQTDPNQPVHLVATSYESRNTVISVYSTAEENIRTLSSQGVIVLHDVDSTNLESVPVLINQFQQKFDFIIWNFPCKRAERGADAQVDDIEENKELLRGFFQSAQKFLKLTDNTSRSGEIHVTHKTLEPFCWWNILEIALECGLYFEGMMVFDRYLYPGYINRKALDKKSFPFNDARTFIFTLRTDSTAPSLLRSRSDLLCLGDRKIRLKVDELIRLYTDDTSTTTDDKLNPKKRRKDSS